MELIFKIFQIIVFVLVSIIFVPMIVIVHFFTEAYEDWLGKILKL